MSLRLWRVVVRLLERVVYCRDQQRNVRWDHFCLNAVLKLRIEWYRRRAHSLTIDTHYIGNLKCRKWSNPVFYYRRVTTQPGFF